MNLTIEQMREIVEGAPMWALSYCIAMGEYFAFEDDYACCCYNIKTLKSTITDHDLTDHCTNIKNHVSPLTKVIEK